MPNENNNSLLTVVILYGEFNNNIGLMGNEIRASINV